MSRNRSLALRLLSSSLLAQCAVLGATMIVAGSLTARDFAAFGIVMAISTILAAFNTWTAESRVPVVADDRARALCRAGWTVCALITALLSGVALISWALGQPQLAALLALGSVAALITGTQQLCNGIALRYERQELLARSRVVQGLSNAALLLLLLWIELPGALILSLSLIISITLGVLSMSPPRIDRGWRFARASSADLRLLLRELRTTPVANLMAIGVTQLPFLVLPAAGATQLSGVWALVGRFLAPIAATVNSTLQPIYNGQLAALGRAGDWSSARTYHARWLRAMMALSVGGAVAVAVAVGVVIPLLGPQWSAVAEATVPAVIFYASLAAGLPLSQTLLLAARVDLQWWWSLGRGVAALLAINLAWILDPPIALVTWACVSAMSWPIQAALHRRALHELAAGRHT